jgi:hypothetical protein
MWQSERGRPPRGPAAPRRRDAGGLEGPVVDGERAIRPPAGGRIWNVAPAQRPPRAPEGARRSSPRGATDQVRVPFPTITPKN